MRATPVAWLIALIAAAPALAETAPTRTVSQAMLMSVMVLAPGTPVGGAGEVGSPRMALENASRAIILSRNAEADGALQRAQAGLEANPVLAASADPNAPPLAATVARARHALATGDQRGAQLLIADTLQRLPAP